MADPEWELSKENIQPLKQGRRMSMLNTVLNDTEDTHKLLMEQRSVFETEIRSYDGSDPLDPWYRYISWVEQSFPKGGKEGNIHKLLEKCITKFKEEKDAKEDPRFLEVWLKYASMAINPLNIYEYMYNNGMCTQQAGLYDAWAWHLETQDKFKAAESVYIKGIDALTDQEIKYGLKQRKCQFESRVAKRMKGEEISEVEILEQEQRRALGRLRGEGKHGKVNSIRIGGALTASGPGVHRPDNHIERKALKPCNSGAIKIFQDSEVGESRNEKSVSEQVTKSVRSNIIPSKSDHKENILDPGKWTKAAKEKKSVNVPLNRIGELAPKQGFILHQDEVGGDYEKEALVTPHKLIPGQSNVLSARKQEKDISIAMALFEPFDPTKRAMYCKNLIYQGTTEFSFEELRAMKWRTREKKLKEDRELEQKRLQLIEAEKALKEKEERLMEMQRMMQLQQQQYNSEAVMKHYPPPPPSVKVIKPSLSSTSSGLSSSDTSIKKSSMDDTQRLVNTNACGGRTNSFTSKSITPSPHRPLKTCHPSPTVNTKEAMEVMQQLWANTTETDNVETDDVFLPASTPFQIHCDNDDQLYHNKISTQPSKQNVPAPFPIFSDSQQQKLEHQDEKPAFVIFSDDGQEPQMQESCKDQKQFASGFQVFSDDVEQSASAHPQNQDVDNVEDKENNPPDGYNKQKIDRPKSGVLTPAQGIECTPIEEQEDLVEEYEEDGNIFRKPLVPRTTSSNTDQVEASVDEPAAANNNATMFIPSQHEFEKMAANVASTPFTGKGFIPFDEDDETCAVELVYNNENQQLSPTAATTSPTQTKIGGIATFHLSPIVEVSRELYRSSSSSSDTTQHSSTRGTEFSKSHWGNTGITTINHNQHRTLGLGGDNTTGLSVGMRTPGSALGCTSASSGYAGDRSSMYTSSHKTKQTYNKQEDDEEEDTGMLGMLSEFKQTLANPVPEINLVQTSGVERSFQPSLLGEDLRVLEDSQTLLPTPRKLQFQGLDMTNMTEARTISNEMSKFEATGLNMTEASTGVAATSINLTAARMSPSLDVTTGGDMQLNLTKPGQLDLTKPSSNLSHMQATPNDVTLEVTTNQLSQLDIPSTQTIPNIDPFSIKTQQDLLQKIDVAVDKRHGYVKCQGNLPRTREKTLVQVGDDRFFIKKLKGEGGFAKVFSAMREDTDMNCTIAGIDAALKVQSPANEWEWYICTEVQDRIKKSNFALLSSSFMAIPRNYNFNNGSIFVSYHQELGTLLDAANQLKNRSGGDGKEAVAAAMYFAVEIFQLVEALHTMGIIHADIKPDNFLLKRIPSVPGNISCADDVFNADNMCLQLIDFGKAIDLRILPKDITFDEIIKTEGLYCVPMREKTRWREHIDYHGIAASVYCVLFGQYMDIIKTRSGVWEEKGTYKRGWNNQMLLKSFFREFINTSQGELPSLSSWREKFITLFMDTMMYRSLKFNSK